MHQPRQPVYAPQRHEMVRGEAGSRHEADHLRREGGPPAGTANRLELPVKRVIQRFEQSVVRPLPGSPLVEELLLGFD